MKKIVPNESPTTVLRTNEIAKLQTAVDQKATQIDVLAETNRKLNKEIHNLRTELEKKNARKKKRKTRAYETAR